MRINLKSLVLGILLGGSLMASLPIGAAIEEYICYKADYKVVISGTEYTNQELPILNYKGNTYAPFRSILVAAGLNVNWNAQLKQAEVTNPDTTSISQPTQQTSMLGGENMSEIITQTPDGIKVFQYEDQNYIDWLELRKKCESLGLKFKIENNTFNFKKSDNSLICSLNLYTIINPYNSVKYDDYISIALPSIQ
jgi:hypothetical protein